MSFLLKLLPRQCQWAVDVCLKEECGGSRKSAIGQGVSESKEHHLLDHKAHYFRLSVGSFGYSVLKKGMIMFIHYDLMREIHEQFG